MCPTAKTDTPVASTRHAPERHTEAKHGRCAVSISPMSREPDYHKEADKNIPHGQRYPKRAYRREEAIDTGPHVGVTLDGSRELEVEHSAPARGRNARGHCLLPVRARLIVACLRVDKERGCNQEI